MSVETLANPSLFEKTSPSSPLSTAGGPLGVGDCGRGDGDEAASPTAEASVRQRVRAELEVQHLAGGSFAAFNVEGRSGGVGGPEFPALPAGLRTVEAAVHCFGENAYGIGIVACFGRKRKRGQEACRVYVNPGRSVPPGWRMRTVRGIGKLPRLWNE